MIEPAELEEDVRPYARDAVASQVDLVSVHDWISENYGGDAADNAMDLLNDTGDATVIPWDLTSNNFPSLIKEACEYVSAKLGDKYEGPIDDLDGVELSNYLTDVENLTFEWGAQRPEPDSYNFEYRGRSVSNDNLIDIANTRYWEG